MTNIETGLAESSTQTLPLGVACPVPANLEAVLGYTGYQRYVGWWETGEELALDDGQMGGVGYPFAWYLGWLFFTSHPNVRESLEPYLAPMREPMDRILVLDRDERRLHVVDKVEGRRFLWRNRSVCLSCRHPAVQATHGLAGHGQHQLQKETSAMLAWLNGTLH